MKMNECLEKLCKIYYQENKRKEKKMKNLIGGVVIGVATCFVLSAVSMAILESEYKKAKRRSY